MIIHLKQPSGASPETARSLFFNAYKAGRPGYALTEWGVCVPTAAELFQHFKDNKPQVTIDSAPYWVIEGDLLVNQDQLWSYSLKRAKRTQTTNAPLEEREGLVAITNDDGRIVRWRQGKLLTYCVRRASFHDNEYEMVLKALHAATADWQAICGVQFQHLAELDLEESSIIAPPLLFDVVGIHSEAKPVATAFFPNDPPQRLLSP